MKKSNLKQLIFIICIFYVIFSTFVYAQMPEENNPYLLYLKKSEEMGLSSASGSMNVDLLSKTTVPEGLVPAVFVEGNYAYISAGISLVVLDISDPYSPIKRGSVAIPGNPFAALELFIVGDYAYVAAGYAGLCVIDVSNKDNPTVRATYRPGGWDFALGVDVVGDYAYVAAGNSGLRIVNISAPGSPVEEGFFDTASYAWDVSVVSNYAYVADGFDGLRVIDVISPSLPVEVGSLGTPGDARGVAVFGNYAYVAAQESGLHIIDISDPRTPVERSSFNTRGMAWGVYVKEFLSSLLAYVADDAEGLRVINVSNPSAPSEMGFYDTEGLAGRDYVATHPALGDVIYVADAMGGLYILRYSLISVDVRVRLQGRSDHSTGPGSCGNSFIHFQMREAGTRICLTEADATTNAEGYGTVNFSVSPGAYDITAEYYSGDPAGHLHYLRAIARNVTLPRPLGSLPLEFRHEIPGIPEEGYLRGGDCNTDNRVNITDFSIMAARYGQTVPPSTPGDFNCDLRVNITDFSILGSNYGKSGVTGCE